MRRLGTLVMAILVITGCNAMQPNMEEAELLRKETEKNIQKWAITIKAEASPAEKPRNTPEPTVEIPQNKPALTQKPAPPAPTPTLEQDITETENIVQPAQATPQQVEQPKGTPAMIDWPYPAITCPPKPEWPQITCPPEPASTPKLELDTPQEEPTPVPVVPAVPVDPAPEATEQPAKPDPTPTQTPPAMPEPTPTPTGGYAVCSCGAKLTPEEVLPHMKAHAMNGESHSYRAY